MLSNQSSLFLSPRKKISVLHFNNQDNVVFIMQYCFQCITYLIRSPRTDDMIII